MNRDQVKTLIITIIIIGLTTILIKYIFNSISFKVIPKIHIEMFESNGWKFPDSCGFKMNESIRKVMDKYKIPENTDNWQFYVPCDYNYIDLEIQNINTNNLTLDKKFFILHNADELTSKSSIWTHLISKYGLLGAKKIMPLTYRIDDKNDMDLFNLQYDSDKLYIMKKNIQRQEGLKITNDKQEILNATKNNYVVVQELLQNPYLINGRKINMRLYVLVVCHNRNLSVYVHKEGFMYYTKDKFKKNSTSPDVNITTGYIDRNVYKTNPLTLGDFREYLDKQRNTLTIAEIQVLEEGNKVSRYVFYKIYDIIGKAVESVRHKLCAESKIDKFTSLQLFGADISLSNNLIPHIMEFNKGPDMGSKDERDGAIKDKVMSDIFRTVGMLDGPTDFIQIKN